jgi:hypothetical protein
MLPQGSVLVVLQFCFWLMDVSIIESTDRCFRLESPNCAYAGTRYQTLDNVDGKQARRTGTSSGLGELFEYVKMLMVF